MKLELAPQFVQNIDWKQLRNQKEQLLTSIEDFKIDSKEANNAGEPELARRYDEQIESITGIIHLIDAIQDYAVDTCEVPEKTVFNLK